MAITIKGTEGVSKVEATGTPSASTFLRGDYAWEAAGGGATLIASDTSLGGTTVAFSVVLSTYKLLIISTSNVLGGGDVSSASTPGNQYTTFDLTTGLYWTWTRNAMSAGVVAPISLPATGLQMGYNNGVSTATTTLTFSLDAGDDFNAGLMYIYGL